MRECAGLPGRLNTGLDMKQSREGGFIREGFGWLDSIMSPQKPKTGSTVDSVPKSSQHTRLLYRCSDTNNSYSTVWVLFAFAVLGCEPQA